MRSDRFCLDTKRALFFVMTVYILCLCGCGSSYDPRLKNPDCCGGGYNLTPLGALVYGPWEAADDGYNEMLYVSGKEIISIGRNYTSLQQNLVFELLQDGSLHYWFKSDYDSTLAKKSSQNENGVKTISEGSPKDRAIKVLYKSGRWKANFSDSSIVIEFGANQNISPLKGKYLHLGGNTFKLQQTSFFDSIYNGKHEKYQKVITTYFTHPWVNN
jgi:hypothetical protein